MSALPRQYIRPTFTRYFAADPGYRLGWNTYDYRDRAGEVRYRIGLYLVLGSVVYGVQWARPRALGRDSRTEDADDWGAR